MIGYIFSELPKKVALLLVKRLENWGKIFSGVDQCFFGEYDGENFQKMERWTV